MKRNLFTIIIALFIVINANAQTILFEEDFSSGSLPTGWGNTDIQNPTKLWEFDNPGGRTFNSTTNANGFAIFDSEHYPANGTNEEADLISSDIDCSSSTVVRLRFEHFLDANWGGSGKLFVSGNNGSTWTQIDAWASTSPTNPAIAEYDISSVAAGNAQVKIKWKWEGVWSMYWCLDDVKVFEPGADDLGVSEIILPAGIEVGTTVPVSATIQNYGSSEIISSFDVHIIIEDASSSVVFEETKTFTDVIAVSGSMLAVMDNSFISETAGIHTVTATVILTGDINPDNNTNSNSTIIYDMGGEQIFSSGGIVTHLGAGADGADVSAPQNSSLNLNIIGKKFSISYDTYLADDFVIPDGEVWTINSMKFYGYQTGAQTSPSSFTDIRIKIYDAAPNAGGTVIRDFSASSMLTVSFWSGIYRVSQETNLSETTRPVMELICSTPEIVLGTGTYWVEYQAAGSLVSGPWSPMVSIPGVANTGNALQYDGSWASIVDNGHPQGVPFELFGSKQIDSYLTTFHITDIAGGANLEGAHVTVTNGTNIYEGDSDIDGNYIADLNAGDYTYTVTLNGYDDYIVTTPYTVSEISAIEIAMSSSTGVHNLTENEFRIYPNPSNGMVTFESENTKNLPLSYEIFDINGQKILSRSYNTSKSKETLDLSYLSKGIYTVKISVEGKSAFRKLILMK